MPPTTTRTVGLNAAFLQEIKEDHVELRRLIEETGEIWSGNETCLSQVGECFQRLLRQLYTHFELEEAYGYFQDALIEQPWLGKRAESLRSQHADLASQMEHLVQRAQSPHQDKPMYELQSDFERFLRDFGQHESDEIDLIMAAFTDEVGVGD